jgi:hypothetical protein
MINHLTAQKYLEITEIRFAIKSTNYKRPPYTADRSSCWEYNMLSVTKSEFFHLLRINLRLQRTLPRLRRLFADVSSLRSSWADPREIHVCGEQKWHITHTHTHRVLRFPSQYHSSNVRTLCTLILPFIRSTEF